MINVRNSESKTKKKNWRDKEFQTDQGRIFTIRCEKKLIDDMEKAVRSGKYLSRSNLIRIAIKKELEERSSLTEGDI